MTPQRREAWRRRGAAALGLFDLRDLIGFGGLAMVFHGVSLLHRPAAFIITGAALFGLAVIRARASGGDSQ